MEQINFSKYSGAGNDFILIDNRTGDFPIHNKEIIPKMSARRISIGADGVILLEKPDSKEADFKMKYYNCDGSEAEMCGNGARCLIAFAKKLGIEKESYSFETLAGIHQGHYVDNEVEVEITSPTDILLNINLDITGTQYTVHSINTGVPHAVVFVDNIDNADVTGLGRKIRYHEQFQPKGTNVNFVEIYDEDYIKIRTYERGIEDETLACGTGIVASSILSHIVKKVTNPVWILVRSNEILRVDFVFESNTFSNVTLRGSATLIYDGVYYYNKRGK